jgi:hypothetical protein
MAEGSTGLNITFKAARDLSSYQYHFVSVSAANTVDYSGDAGRCIGILQNAPNAANEAAVVMVEGISKLRAYGAVNRLEKLKSSAQTGYVAHGELAATASDWIGAIALETGTASDDLLTVLITGFELQA